MKIDKDQVFESMKKEGVIVLNVLPKSDYKRLHIKGSENHPLTEDPEVFSKEVKEKYGKGKSFIVYGDHFGLLDSFLAAKGMEAQGLQVLNYAGGIQEWHRAGLPVAGTETVLKVAEKA
jgi:rhodanese-related sulfurtransferase